MNIRKPVDYSQMYEALDILLNRWDCLLALGLQRRLRTMKLHIGPQRKHLKWVLLLSPLMGRPSVLGAEFLRLPSHRLKA